MMMMMMIDETTLGCWLLAAPCSLPSFARAEFIFRIYLSADLPPPSKTREQTDDVSGARSGDP